MGLVVDAIFGGTRAARRAEKEYNEAQLRAGELQKEFLKEHYEAANKRVEEARKNAAEAQRRHMEILEKQREVEEELQKASEAIIESTLDLHNLDTEKLTLVRLPKRGEGLSSVNPSHIEHRSIDTDTGHPERISQGPDLPQGPSNKNCGLLL